MLALIFVTVSITHWSSTVLASYDSAWTIYTAMSVLHGNTNLDEYQEIIPDGDYRIETVDGHLYSKYPIGASLIALPVLFLLDGHQNSLWPRDLYEYLKHNEPGPVTWAIEKLVASLIVALTTVFVYLIATRFLDLKYSLLIAVIFAYGTSAWSTASRALWTHGPSMLMLTLTLFIVLQAKDSPRTIQWASLPLTASYAMRPTNLFPLLLFTLFVFIRYRDFFGRFLIWALPIIILFISYNLTIYHTVLSSYYRAESLEVARNLWDGLAGTLFSPSRGLFIFSPIFAFSVLGVIAKFKGGRLETLDFVLLGILLLHWLLLAAIGRWDGGLSFGPRLFTDMLPFLTYFLIIAMAEIPKSVGARRILLNFAFALCAIMSIFVNYRGANDWDVIAWNWEPDSILQTPERVWDWRDPQFLRGIKLGIDGFSSLPVFGPLVVSQAASESDGRAGGEMVNNVVREMVR